MNGQHLAGVLPVRSRGDSTERLTCLFNTHYRRLFRLARRLVSSADDAHDLVQEAFFKAVRSPESVPAGIPDEEAWLVRVLINVRRDQWRKASIRARHQSDARRHQSAGRPGCNPESTLIVRTTVWQALDLLPPRRRAVVIMHELEGFAVPAIAALLGISAITVRWHLAAGKRELTKALKPYMGDAREDH